MLFDLKVTKQVSTEIDMITFVPSNFARLPKLYEVCKHRWHFWSTLSEAMLEMSLSDIKKSVNTHR